VFRPLRRKLGSYLRPPSTLLGIRFPRPPVSVTRRDICRQYRGAGSLPCKRPNMNVPSFRFSGTDNLRGLLIQCCDYRGVGIRIRIRGVIGNTSGEYQPFPRRLEIYLETVAPGGLVCAQVRLVLIPKSEKPPHSSGSRPQTPSDSLWRDLRRVLSFHRRHSCRSCQHLCSHHPHPPKCLGHSFPARLFRVLTYRKHLVAFASPHSPPSELKHTPSRHRSQNDSSWRDLHRVLHRHRVNFTRFRHL